ncbi:unnamed protein product, partial [Pleuronectes platessa]
HIDNDICVSGPKRQPLRGPTVPPRGYALELCDASLSNPTRRSPGGLRAGCRRQRLRFRRPFRSPQMQHRENGRLGLSEASDSPKRVTSRAAEAERAVGFAIAAPGMADASTGETREPRKVVGGRRGGEISRFLLSLLDRNTPEPHEAQHHTCDHEL